MSEQKQELNEPGKILRTAREEMKLSLDQVADQLHLRPSVVEALEREDYSEFTSDVFLKGYFRSYCRLVNLHEGRMVELLDRSRANSGNDAGSAEQHEQAGTRLLGRNWFKYFVAAIIAIVIVAAGMSVWQSLGGSAAPEDETAPIQSEKQKYSAPVESDEIAEIESSEIQRIAPTVDSGSATDDATAAVPGESPSLDQQSLQAPAVVEEKADIEVLSPLPEQAEASQAAETEEADIALDIMFSGDCWLQIKELDGRTLKANLQRAGSQVSLRSSAVLDIVLGDARQAQVRVNGNDFDLAAYTARNGRAQFSLDPSTRNR